MIVAQPCGTKKIHAVVSSATSLPCFVIKTICGMTIGRGSWGVYEVRGQKINCSECIKKENDMNETMDTIPPDGLTEPVPHEETNGHAVKRKSRSVMRREAAMRDEPAPAFDALTNAKAFLADQKSTVDTKKILAAALRHEIQERAALLVQLEGTPINHFPVRAPREKAKPAPAKPGRKPRENSVPNQVFKAIDSLKGSTAAEIAECTGLTPVQVHGALHGLKKAGRVRCKGERKDRVWLRK